MLHVRKKSFGTTHPRVQGNVVVLEEHAEYVFSIEDASAATLRLGEQVLPLAEDGFQARIGFWVGTQTLEIHRGNEITRYAVRVEPATNKLEPELWLSLLADLERWVPGVTCGIEGGLMGAVRTQGASASHLAAALLPLVPDLIARLRRLLATPRERLTVEEHELPAHAVRRVDVPTVRWLAQHPEVFRRAFNAMRGDEEPLVPQAINELTLDHPANKYVAYLVRRIIRALESLAESLVGFGVEPHGISDTADWCRARAESAARGAQQLRELLQHSFLRELTPASASEAALLVVQDDPLYAGVHRLGRLFLDPRYQLDGEGPQAPMRPSFDMYELWCFLSIYEELQRAHKPETVRLLGARNLFDGTGAGASVNASLPGGTLTLHFNLRFPGYLSRGDAERWSNSATRRPDIVARWRGDDGARWWKCFDAKYRVSPSALEEAFESAHIYRDSLRWPEAGGRCREVLLLVPRSTPRTAPWFAETFRADHEIGCIELRPGQSREELVRAISPSASVAPDGSDSCHRVAVS